ncbi:MAG: DUF1848 family protein, partial [Polyangiaceae bacterium]|nr:DUF1848 family protein [Polyangiaceae bacterium]
MEIFTCAEDLAPFGICPGACVDGELIRQLWNVSVTQKKDSGQRDLCKCVVSRDIGMPDTLYWLPFASAAGSTSSRRRTSLVRSAGSGNVVVVIAAVRTRLRAFTSRTMARVKAAWRRLTGPLPLVAGVAGDLVRSRQELMAENTLLRQQLIVASRTVNRPKLQPHERGLLVLLARLVPRWRDALLLVKPETVLRWHRAGFRLFWRHRSKPDARREPK